MAVPNSKWLNTFCKTSQIDESTLFLKFKKKVPLFFEHRDLLVKFLQKEIYSDKEIELVLLSQKEDSLQNYYYKFTLEYKKLPLLFEEVIVQLSKEGRLKLITGSFIANINVSEVPTFNMVEPFALGWYRKEGILYLVYIQKSAHQKSYIDAHSGELLYKESFYKSKKEQITLIN